MGIYEDIGQKNDFALVPVRERQILFPYKGKDKQDMGRFVGIDEVLESFLALIDEQDTPPKALVIRAGTGTGKTYKTIRSLSQSIKMGKLSSTVLHFVLDHKTAEEAKGFYAEFGIYAFHLKGRRAAGCARIELVEEFYDKGLSTKGLCGRSSSDQKGGVPAELIPQERGCPFYEGCAWIETRQTMERGVDHPVVIAPLEYLRSGGLPKGMNPSLVVFDEGFFAKVIEAEKLSVSDLGKTWKHAALKPEDRSRIEEAVKLLLILSAEGKLTAEALKSPQITAEMHQVFLDAARLRRRELKALGLEDPEKTCASRPVQKIEMSLWETLAEICGEERQRPLKLAQFHGILSESRSTLEISTLFQLDIPCPVIALDASADEDIYRHVLEDSHQVFFERLQEEADNLRRIAIIGQGFSTSSLLYEGNSEYQDGNLTRKPQEEAAKRRLDLEKALNVIAQKEKGRRVLVCCTKAIEEHFLTTGFAQDFQEKCRPSFIHFGQAKGVNAYDDYETIIVIGKLEVPSSTMILMARAFNRHDVATTIKNDYLPKHRIKRILQTKAGQGAALATFTYKDPTAARLHAYLRDEEIYQAIGRLRSVKRKDEDLRCYILSDAIPNHMLFDDIHAIEDLTSDGLLTGIARSYGQCLSAVAYMNNQHASKQAASDAMKKRGFSGASCHEGWQVFKCKVKGRSGPPSFIYSTLPDSPETREIVSAHLRYVVFAGQGIDRSTIVIESVTPAL